MTQFPEHNLPAFPFPSPHSYFHTIRRKVGVAVQCNNVSNVIMSQSRFWFWDWMPWLSFQSKSSNKRRLVVCFPQLHSSLPNPKDSHTVGLVPLFVSKYELCIKLVKVGLVDYLIQPSLAWLKLNSTFQTVPSKIRSLFFVLCAKWDMQHVWGILSSFHGKL